MSEAPAPGSRDTGDPLDHRPSADVVLARTQAELGTGKARLRVYIGMAPGVGKTYRMLEEAHRRAERGTDVVVGFVECHGRPRTEALLEGLETVPRHRTEHRGIVAEEMDTDAVIARRPTVALIDELAHTNIPGSPREKRWQDVRVILDSGIHVISTLNIQHLESMAEAVETITGAPVRERLPDDTLAWADEIELVDMSPHALRQRMRHGNVYPPDRTRIALDRFFTEANLTALRELSLRIAAERVEGQLEAMVERQEQAIPAVTDRVGVLVDGSDAGPDAIRRAADLAGLLRVGLVALVMESASGQPDDWQHTRAIREDTDRALDLGAEVVRVPGDPGDALPPLLRQRRVTHLVVPYRPSGRMERLRGPSLPERIISALPGVEIHLVSHQARRAGNAPDTF